MSLSALTRLVSQAGTQPKTSSFLQTTQQQTKAGSSPEHNVAVELPWDTARFQENESACRLKVQSLK